MLDAQPTTAQAVSSSSPSSGFTSGTVGAPAGGGSDSPLPSEQPRLNQPRPERPSAVPDTERYFAREGVDPLPHAFAGKIAIHPGFGGDMTPPEQFDAVLNPLLDQPRRGVSVAYIHVPFCETHCLYCGFYNMGYRKEESRVYAGALIRELDLWRGRPAQEEGPVHAVYLGGGTPTALEAEDLRRILQAVRDKLPLANDCEITVEGRLSHFGPDKIEACLEGGANRFSLGVQSFNTEIRQAMGRLAPREEAIERLQTLQAYNQAAVIVDLIYGFPMQTMERWLDDIATTHSLRLDGADCYQLNVYKHSPLGKAIEAGKLPAGADIPRQSAMFAAGVAAMEGAFYRRLSVSHWGRTPRERNLYNQYVKGRAHCLAFGPGAGGNLDGTFFLVESDYKKWLEAVGAGCKPVAMVMRPHPLTPLTKAVAEELEQCRLNLPRLEQEYSVPLGRVWAPVLAQWERAGLVEKRGEALALTLAGQFWQVNISQLLLDYLKHALEQ